MERQRSGRKPVNAVAKPRLFMTVGTVGLITSSLWAVLHTHPTPLMGSRPDLRGPIDSRETTFPITAGQTLGSENAPLVLVEFADFQCPYSAEFAGRVLP